MSKLPMIGLVLSAFTSAAGAADPPTEDQALAALAKRGARFNVLTATPDARPVKGVCFGAKETPTIAPSGERRRATIWPQGSSRGGWRRSWPAAVSSSAAASSAARSATSNSMLTWGVVRCSGQSFWPKQAWAAWVRGQTPKCRVPATSSLWK